MAMPKVIHLSCVSLSQPVNGSEILLPEEPKAAIFTLTKEACGEIDVDTPSMLPHNRQQISIVCRSHNAHDKNVLYTVMLESKLTQGKEYSFVRDVKAAPSQSFYWQLRDMECFLTDNRQFGVHLLQYG